jgi:hypothetical protein
MLVAYAKLSLKWPEADQEPLSIGEVHHVLSILNTNTAKKIIV